MARLYNGRLCIVRPLCEAVNGVIMFTKEEEIVELKIQGKPLKTEEVLVSQSGLLTRRMAWM